MRPTEIESWALRIIERVGNNQPVEDSRVELKREWPTDHFKAARRIGGHANAARGERILWLIGIDEVEGIVGVDYQEVTNWLQGIESQFSHLAPPSYHLNVPTNLDRTVAAIVFETSRAPFVVKNQHYGTRQDDPISLEVPWRDGTRVRSATRADLLLILSDASSLTALLNELEWNLDVAMRVGPFQWQYRSYQFENFFGKPDFNLLPEGLQRSIRDAHVEISHAQSLVRSYETASIQGRANLGGEMINARIQTRAPIQDAVTRLRGFLGII